VLVAAPTGKGGVASAVDAVVQSLGPTVSRVRPYDVLAARADVVHLHPSLRSRSLLRDAVLAAAASARGARVVLSLHGFDFELADRLDRHPRLRRLLLRANVVSVLARPFAERLARWGIDAEVVPNAVDPAALPAERRPERSVLYLGRLSPEKRVHLLIEACAELGVPLTIAGDGPERDRLAARHPLLGWVDTPTKRELLARAGVLALPSTGEAFPVAVAEALAAGVPVVASGGGALPELVGDAGLVDPPDLAEALRAMLDRPPPSAAARVRALCDPEAVAARWWELYRKALA
jgi:glycosyltransferase involved in cell wall biosynthesis